MAQRASKQAIFKRSKMNSIKKSLSRGPMIDTDVCVQQVGGNRFDLVIIASARARELKRQHQHGDRSIGLHAPVQALLEIQSGKIGKEYLAKVR